MKTLILLASVAVLGTSTDTGVTAAHASTLNWTRCVERLEPDGVIGETSCRSYPIVRRHGSIRGMWHRTRIRGNTRVQVSYPRFVRTDSRAGARRSDPGRPAAPARATSAQTSGPCRSSCYRVTGYCTGATGAWGDPVFYGMVANNWLPRGTHIRIPSLGFAGVVEDHIGSGTDFDLFTFDCHQAFNFTGYRQVIVG